MSARRFSSFDLFNPVTVLSRTTRLDLAPNAVTIRKSGIEFRSQSPISPWTELTIGLETSLESRKMECTGVVVQCNGNRHTGYNISIVFTDLSRQAQAQLSSLLASTHSRLA